MENNSPLSKIRIDNLMTGVIRLNSTPRTEIKPRAPQSTRLTNISTSIPITVDCLNLQNGQKCFFWWIVKFDGVSEYKECPQQEAVLSNSNGTFSIKINDKDPELHMLKLGLIDSGAVGFGVQADFPLSPPAICEPKQITFDIHFGCTITAPDKNFIGSAFNITPDIDEHLFKNVHLKFIAFESDHGEGEHVYEEGKGKNYTDTIQWTDKERDTRKWMIGCQMLSDKQFVLNYSEPEETGDYEFGYELHAAEADGIYHLMKRNEKLITEIAKPEIKEFKLVVTKGSSPEEPTVITAQGKITGFDLEVVLPLNFQLWEVVDKFKHINEATVALNAPLGADCSFNIELASFVDESSMPDMSKTFGIMFVDRGNGISVKDFFDFDQDYRTFSDGKFSFTKVADCVCSIEAKDLTPPPIGIERYIGPGATVEDNAVIMKMGDKSEYVKVLREDLLKLGYWSINVCENPSNYTISDKFDIQLYSGLKTFQFEHKDSPGITVDGILNKQTADAIINVYNQSALLEEEYERPGVLATKIDTATRFYQLPPSRNKNYRRYGEELVTVAGDLGDCNCNEAWGTKETIEAIIKICDEWAKNNYTFKVGEKEVPDIVSVGDISMWYGGDFPEHQSHKNGRGVDIRTSLAGAMEAGQAKNPNFERDKSVAFANLVIKHGFTRIYTMCPYVTDKVNNFSDNLDNMGKFFVTQCAPHQHHFHIDYNATYSKNDEDRIKSKFILNYSYCNLCGHKPCPFDIKTYVEPPT